MTAFGARPFLYPIIDTGVCATRRIDPVALASAFFAGGARVVQLRQKEGGSGEYLSRADEIVRRARPHAALVIVNDRADVAKLSGADGVHVGQDDLRVADARHILGPAAVVGLSTHDERQIDAALATDATYVAVGPVFGTATKDTGYAARGLDLVRYAARHRRPVVAIGGITLANAKSVVAAGAAGLAVISDLLEGDPESRVRAFIEQLSGTL